MTTPREIPASDILETAMQLVDSARESVRMTMLASEEIANPLPRDYFLLLKKKMEEGIRVERVGFGTKEEFESMRNNVYINHPNYSFTISQQPYQRMLIVDGKKLIFSTREEGKKRFFSTTEPHIVATFTHYFKTVSL